CGTFTTSAIIIKIFNCCCFNFTTKVLNAFLYPVTHFIKDPVEFDDHIENDDCMDDENASL
ncbi:2412_t:CDS:2, partial [Dentiscutata heterogama]